MNKRKRYINQDLSMLVGTYNVGLILSPEPVVVSDLDFAQRAFSLML